MSYAEIAMSKDGGSKCVLSDCLLYRQLKILLKIYDTNYEKTILYIKIINPLLSCKRCTQTPLTQQYIKEYTAGR